MSGRLCGRSPRAGPAHGEGQGGPAAARPALSGCPRAFGAAVLRARVRAEPEDFAVDEVLGIEPCGEGDHLWLRLRKRGTNTEWLARRVAEYAGVRAAAVGYAGLKDRRAVTTQWFSVNLQGRTPPDWRGLDADGAELLAAVRHRRKLRRGAHRANRFRIVLRTGAKPGPGLNERCETLSARGVPNYFGPQRFGHGLGNLEQAGRLFSGECRVRDRHRRGLYLSAARAWMFNRVLAARIRAGCWDRALGGDVMMLEGSRSRFGVAGPDADLDRRLDTQDIHPSGPLWGAGRTGVRGEALALETRTLEPFSTWKAGLEAAGLEMDRRPLRIRVTGLGCEVLSEHAVRLAFQLPAGAYATALLREIVAG